MIPTARALAQKESAPATFVYGDSQTYTFAPPTSTGDLEIRTHDLKRQALAQVFPDAPRPPRGGRMRIGRVDVVLVIVIGDRLREAESAAE